MSKIITKIKAFLKKDLLIVDLKKLYPGYFKKSIFVGVIILMFVIAAWDVSLNDWETFMTTKTKRLECPKRSPNMCYNPFFNTSNIQSPFFQKEYLSPGEYIGRDDFLARNGELLVLSMPFLAFALNHLAYFIRTGNVRYKREDDQDILKTDDSER